MALPESKKQEIIAYYRAGNSMQDVAKRMQVSTQTVHKLCSGMDQDLVQKTNDALTVLSSLSEFQSIEQKAVMDTLDEKLRLQGVYLNLSRRSNRLLSVAQRVISKKVKDNEEAVLEHLPALQTISTIAEKNRRLAGLDSSNDGGAKAIGTQNIQINFV